MFAIRRSTKERTPMRGGIEGDFAALPRVIENLERLTLPKRDSGIVTDLFAILCALRACFGQAPSPRGYSLSTQKVSQADNSPCCNPLRNQRTRCSELPWVKLSGVT